MQQHKPAILWYRLQKDKEGVPFWDFNHLEDGHCETNVPTPKIEEHKKVWHGQWKKEFVFLDDRNVVQRTC